MSKKDAQKKSIFIVKDGKTVLEPKLAKHIAEVVNKYNLARMKPIK
jgi:hypothetical protein